MASRHYKDRHDMVDRCVDEDVDRQTDGVESGGSWIASLSQKPDMALRLSISAATAALSVAALQCVLVCVTDVQPWKYNRVWLQHNDFSLSDIRMQRGGKSRQTSPPQVSQYTAHSLLQLTHGHDKGHSQVLSRCGTRLARCANGRHSRAALRLRSLHVYRG